MTPRLLAAALAMCFVTSSVHGAMLVGHWTFDDSPATNGATLTDVSGSTNQHDAELNTVLGNAAVAGQIGGAFDFTASGSDYVDADLGADYVSGTNPASFSVWFNHDSIGGQSFMFAWGSNSAGQNVRASFESGAGVNYLRHRHQGGYVEYVVPSDLATTGWHHLAAVVPASGVDSVGDILFYLDGSLLTGQNIVNGDDAFTIVDGYSGSLFIGSNWTGATAFDGQLDDAAFFVGELTAQEIEDIHSAGLNGDDVQTALGLGDGGGPQVPAPAALPAALAMIGLIGLRRRSTKLTTGRRA